MRMEKWFKVVEDHKLLKKNGQKNYDLTWLQSF